MRRERARDDDHHDVGREPRAHLPVRLSHSAAHPIALRGAAELPADGEAHSPGFRATPERDKRWTLEPLAMLEDRLEVC
jgi:hypothetical protein